VSTEGVANYVLNITASVHFDEYVHVTFPNSNNAECDLPGPEWTTTLSADGCTNEYFLNVPVATLLGKCGFSQLENNDIENQLFQNIVSMETNRSCTAFVTQEASRNVTWYPTRETEFTIRVTSPTTVTATSDDIEVVGTVYQLQLLGDLTIDPDIDTGIPTVTGVFVTSTQWPYQLEADTFPPGLSADINASTWTVNRTVCNLTETDNLPANRPPCQQEWYFSFQTNKACGEKNQLTGDQITLNFGNECSFGFDGECAPALSVQPGLNWKLFSPDYCISSDSIVLIGDAKAYKYDGLTPPVDAFGSADLAVLPGGSFSSENLYTVESVFYCEFTVTVDGSAAELTGTDLQKVEVVAQTEGQDNIVVYDTINGITNTQTFKVYDDNFGTNIDPKYTQYRTRFEFQWLDGVTINLVDVLDATQPVEVVITVVADFTSNLNYEPVKDHPVLSKLARQTHGKSRQSKKSLMAAGDSRNSANFVQATVTRTKTASPSGGDSSDSSVAGVEITTGTIGAAVALVAVFAIVVVVVVKARKNSTSTSTTGNKLPPSSSFQENVGYDLNSLPMVQLDQQVMHTPGAPMYAQQ
jgi:hypothetical protein